MGVTSAAAGIPASSPARISWPKPRESAPPWDSSNFIASYTVKKMPTLGTSRKTVIGEPWRGAETGASELGQTREEGVGGERGESSHGVPWVPVKYGMVWSDQCCGMHPLGSSLAFRLYASDQKWGRLTMNIDYEPPMG
eukprot:7522894-Pyramimonas_sp.AAC.1